MGLTDVRLAASNIKDDISAAVTGEKSLEDRVPTEKYDSDHLKSLMVEAFELLGKSPGEARELATAILKAAERPQSGHLGPRDWPQR
jgi:hypothetical protein